MKLPTFKTFQSNPHYFAQVQQLFNERIAPCYGDQTSAIRKIQEGKDRTCVLLLNDSEAIGIVVFKTALVNEFEDQGIINSFEIKTLCLFNPTHDSGKGYGSYLLSYVAENAIKLNAQAITVTISACNLDSFRFFQTMGFRKAFTLHEHHQKGLDEIVLVHDNPSELLFLIKKFIELKAAQFDLSPLDQKIQKLNRRRAA